MRSFEGFKRIAIVIVPTNEEFLRRIDKCEREEGKHVPDRAVLEMKAKFGLPAAGPLFDAVEYPELQCSEAEKLIKMYNEEGQAAVGSPRRFIPNASSSNRPGRWQRSNQNKGPVSDNFGYQHSPNAGNSFRENGSESNVRGAGRGGRGSGGDHMGRSPNDDQWQIARWDRNDSGRGGRGWNESTGRGDRGGRMDRGGRGRDDYRGGSRRGDRGGESWQRGGGRPGGNKGSCDGWNDRAPRDRGGGGGFNNKGGGGRGSFGNRGGRSGMSPHCGGRGCYN